MAKYLSKGSQIFVEGRLDVYRTQQDGQYITRTNVNVQNVQFLDSKRGSSNNDSMSYDSEPKFNNTEAAAAKSIVEPDTSFEESKPTGNQEDINFDDIKF
ncbi:MAG: hypothetical protein DRP42_03595 [Tenericutes bacterium]|nr:MAG: hypothetical protein DRP42_03595 [Mycoplasmatota bacterium]